MGVPQFVNDILLWPQTTHTKILSLNPLQMLLGQGSMLEIMPEAYSFTRVHKLTNP